MALYGPGVRSAWVDIRATVKCGGELGASRSWGESGGGEKAGAKCGGGGKDKM